jgi:hypothetical protein
LGGGSEYGCPGQVHLGLDVLQLRGGLDERRLLVTKIGFQPSDCFGKFIHLFGFGGVPVQGSTNHFVWCPMSLFPFFGHLQVTSSLLNDWGVIAQAALP